MEGQQLTTTASSQFTIIEILEKQKNIKNQNNTKIAKEKSQIFETKKNHFPGIQASLFYLLHYLNLV